MIVPKLHAIEITELTKAMRASVPTVIGLVDQGDTLLIRHDGHPAFTPQEQARLQAVLATHDALAIQQAKSARDALTRGELAKDPSQLTLPDRIRRIELFLGIEQPA